MPQSVYCGVSDFLFNDPPCLLPRPDQGSDMVGCFEVVGSPVSVNRAAAEIPLSFPGRTPGTSVPDGHDTTGCRTKRDTESLTFFRVQPVAQWIGLSLRQDAAIVHGFFPQ